MPITDLEHDLTDCVNSYINGSRQALANALLEVARPASFRSTLTEILDSETRLRDIAGRSFWHDNGFAKIVLLSQPRYKLRLHIWKEVEQFSISPRGNIHNHRWDFSTILLAGSYRHQEFRPSRRGEQFFAYKYSTTAAAGHYSLVPAGRQILRCVLDAHLAQGSGFTISSDVLHRVTPDGGEPTVSLVLEGPHEPSTSDVFATSEVGENSGARVEVLSADYLRRHINTVLSLAPFAS